MEVRASVKITPEQCQQALDEWVEKHLSLPKGAEIERAYFYEDQAKILGIILFNYEMESKNEG